jgi:hypothetical protein
MTLFKEMTREWLKAAAGGLASGSAQEMTATPLRLRRL